MWFELSIISLVFLSFGYMFARTQKKDGYSSLGLIAVCGLIMGVHAAFMLLLDSDIRSFNIADIAGYLPSILCYVSAAVVGIKFLYSSDRTPTGLYGAAALLFCLAFGKSDSFGENIAVNTVGTILIVAGMILASVPLKKITGKTTVTFAGFAALYCLLRGLASYADGRIVVKRGIFGRVDAGSLGETSALVSFELIFLLAALIALVYLVFVKKEPLFDKRSAPPMIASGVCVSFGMLAYFYAIGNQTARVSLAAACAPAVSLLWSRVFLKEKQPKIKYAALALIAAGLTAFAVVK